MLDVRSNYYYCGLKMAATLAWSDEARTEHEIDNSDKDYYLDEEYDSHDNDYVGGTENIPTLDVDVEVEVDEVVLNLSDKDTCSDDSDNGQTVEECKKGKLKATRINTFQQSHFSGRWHLGGGRSGEEWVEDASVDDGIRECFGELVGVVGFGEGIDECFGEGWGVVTFGEVIEECFEVDRGVEGFGDGTFGGEGVLFSGGGGGRVFFNKEMNGTPPMARGPTSLCKSGEGSHSSRNP
ncbi:hypothetical protein L6452_40498 [Arctium lappa]|uniref:Uncharacterized protein n=1 Tax=Arctium lappa TaxID=4217 RepID=A0ACB8XMB3_ARCLA|nr:hypothetical protein L6452_40498 [Arctium lappa]